MVLMGQGVAGHHDDDAMTDGGTTKAAWADPKLAMTVWRCCWQ